MNENIFDAFYNLLFEINANLSRIADALEGDG